TKIRSTPSATRNLTFNPLLCPDALRRAIIPNEDTFLTCFCQHEPAGANPFWMLVMTSSLSTGRAPQGRGFFIAGSRSTSREFLVDGWNFPS
ncbi:MAG TPA: hypothetical protein PKA03_11645, partial [Tabrizicola sp.]|nr:hypothetical protein [Tabrizicola sp.]